MAPPLPPAIEAIKTAMAAVEQSDLSAEEKSAELKRLKKEYVDQLRVMHPDVVKTIFRGKLVQVMREAMAETRMWWDLKRGRRARPLRFRR